MLQNIIILKKKRLAYSLTHHHQLKDLILESRNIANIYDLDREGFIKIPTTRSKYPNKTLACLLVQYKHQPVRKMTEDHVANENSQHENGLSQILEPESVADEVPLRDYGLPKDAMVIRVLRAIIQTLGIKRFVIGTREFHRRRQKDDAHLVPGDWKLHQENHEAYPYLPLPDFSYCLGQRVHYFGIFGIFDFCLQHCN